MSALVVIHGRRQTSTAARRATPGATARCSSSHRSHSSSPNGAGASTPTASPSAATAGPTSATERGDIECTRSPASTSASASSMPVLLVVHDHEVGRERDDCFDVGILGPADRGQVGLLAEPRARHRVDAEGAQRLGDGRDERDDAQSRGYIRSRSAAFLVSNSSAVMWPLSRRAASCSICSGMLAPAPAAACWGRPAGRLPGVDFHLPVDLLLHPVGMAHVLEVRLALPARRLDVEIAGADHPLEDPLVEVDVVDPLERDLDTVLGEHAGAEDHAVVGHHEVGVLPLDVLDREPHRPDDREDRPGPPGDRLHAAREREHADEREEERDPGEDVLREVPPVRMQVERDRLALVDQVPRVRHGR